MGKSPKSPEGSSWRRADVLAIVLIIVLVLGLLVLRTPTVNRPFIPLPSERAL